MPICYIYPASLEQFWMACNVFKTIGMSYFHSHHSLSLGLQVGESEKGTYCLLNWHFKHLTSKLMKKLTSRSKRSKQNPPTNQPTKNNNKNQPQTPTFSLMVTSSQVTYLSHLLYFTWWWRRPWKTLSISLETYLQIESICHLLIWNPTAPLYKLNKSIHLKQS